MELLFSVFCCAVDVYIIISFISENFSVGIKKWIFHSAVIILCSLLFAVDRIFGYKQLSFIFLVLTDICIIDLLTELTTVWSVLNGLFLAFSFAAGKVLTAYLTPDNDSQQFPLYICFVLLGKTACLMVTKLYTAVRNNLSGKQKYPLYLFLLPSTVIITYSLLLHISGNYNLSANDNHAVNIVSSVILNSLILTYIFYGREWKQLEKNYRQSAEKKAAETQNEYYALIDRQNNELREIIHNERNHLAAIRDMTDNTVVASYIDELTGNLSFHSLFGKSGNNLLDVIISRYIYNCEKNGITFLYSAQTADLTYISSPDLVTLICNILDNAVESSEKSEKKLIELSIRRFNSIDILTCKNSCDKKPLSNRNELLTTKKDKISHGYGMKSIYKTAKKYNGEPDWLYDEEHKTFILRIMFNSSVAEKI